MISTEKEKNALDALYSGRTAFFGDLHNHSDSGGTSDGRCSLAEWRKGMKDLGLDFAAILDHRQVRHMYLPEWEDGTFIGGTEPGTIIPDSNAEVKGMHFNMLFENSAPLEELLSEFPEFLYTGGPEGHFEYPNFTRARMGELIECVKKHGGFFVYPHPTQIMKSENAEDFWFADETGFEVFYCTMDHPETEANYKVWCELLALGKRVWACAGEDRHREPSVSVLTTIYAEEKKNASYLKHLRCGDFVCGSVGIRMCIGDCTMGGICESFEEKKLIVSVKDFHASVIKPEHTYKLTILNDKGIVAEEAVGPEKESCFTFDAEPCRFYRAEIADVTDNLRIAIGNPIWCGKKN